MGEGLSAEATGLAEEAKQQGMSAVGDAQRAGESALEQARKTGEGLAQQGQQTLSKWLCHEFSVVSRLTLSSRV